MFHRRIGGALTCAKRPRWIAPDRRKAREEPVRTLFRLAIVAPILFAALGKTADAQGNAVYVASYVELMPSASASGAALLKRYRDAGRKQAGNLRFDALVEIARDNRFVIIEAWKDKTALDTHVQNAESVRSREKLNPIQDAPVDRRVTHALYLQQGDNANRAGAIYVVTHIDVIPPGTEACIAALKMMSADTPQDTGNISYGVLQQLDHANHFTVVEEWTNRKAIAVHAIAPHTRAFRDKLKPIAGALYDERLYTALN
jgi:quinol monooxygenase YgiN